MPGRAGRAVCSGCELVGYEPGDVAKRVTPIRPVRYPSQRCGPVPGQGDFGALSAVREEQPEVKPYCARVSCACLWKRGCVSWRRAGLAVCGPVRGEGRAIAGPGAGRCEGRAEALLAGGVRAAGRGCAWWFRARPGDIKL